MFLALVVIATVALLSNSAVGRRGHSACGPLPNLTPDVPYNNHDYDYGEDEDECLPRNLIMMIPDGTSPSMFTLARTYLDASQKTKLHIDPLLSGTVQTHSTDSYVTDSASSATAYASGEKTYNKAIGVDVDGKPLGTILEAAKTRGMVVGMVVTSRITHATPASFAAHVKHRDSEDEIATQYVKNKNLDFVLGGGKKHFTDNQIKEMEAAGYTMAYTKQDLRKIRQSHEKSGKLKIMGLFARSNMHYEMDRERHDSEPDLQEMVHTMLSILKNNPVAQKNGFFMLVEGSRIDHAAHSNDGASAALEAIMFDKSVGVVKQFIHGSKNTALISCADHGTGGMTLGRDDIYEWHPKYLHEQKMSTEDMVAVLEKRFAEEKCDKTSLKGSKTKCRNLILSEINRLVNKYTYINETMSTKWHPELNEKIDAVFAKEEWAFYYLGTSIGHVISEKPLIGWTTGAHEAVDVNLYCFGPRKFEDECRGNHQNYYINRIMRKFLNLDIQRETLRLREESRDEL